MTSQPPPMNAGHDPQYTLGQLMAGQQAPPAGPPPAGGYYQPPSPPAQPPPQWHWWRSAGKGGQAVIVALAVMVPLALAALLIAMRMGDGRTDDVTVTMNSCTFSGSGLSSVTVEFTATNASSYDHRIRIDWKFRDSAGKQVDTDSTSVTVPAGDTIRDSETTLLPVNAAGGSCAYKVR